MQVVYGHVKSHTKHLPCDHGTSVKPSGRLPSFRDSHDGSSLAGISAAVSARFMRSLTTLCRNYQRAGLDHAQGVSAQAVVQAARDRASRFRANGRRRRHGPARPLNRNDAAAGEEST